MDTKHRMIADYLRQKKAGKLLDAGGGEGALYRLLGDHFDVTVCDINVSSKGIKIDRVDLNKGLPYKTNTFDYLTCIEVVEHLENPHHLIREFRRVLKPGGYIIITTPNISNIFSRIKFLLTGTFFCFSKGERESRNGHINPIPYWELESILEKNNFVIIEMLSAEYLRLSGVATLSNTIKRLISNLVYLILYPIIYPKNRVLLKGDNIIVIARKQ